MKQAVKVLKSVEELRHWSAAKKMADQPIALVPTMGHLHSGHGALMQRAKKDDAATLVSIFVNPSQFGPDEDLARYPRTLSQDLSLCEANGVEAVFAPDVQTVYPKTFATYIAPTRLTENLCGASRPGHFRGVCTVVAILFNLSRCDTAVFGEKDFQQLQIVRRMVRDLWFDVEVVGVPTVRDSDGVARSSRNIYLSPEQRLAARVLPTALNNAKKALEAGQIHGDVLLRVARETIAAEPQARIDYISLVDPDDLQTVELVQRHTLLAAALFVGATRLIDNILLKPTSVPTLPMV